MGYVAELQQFDPVPSHVYALGGPEPATEILPVFPPPAPAPALPRGSAVPIVSHIRQQSQRRIRAAVIAGAAMAILAGAGLSYTALGSREDTPRAQAPGIAASGVPTDGSLLLDPALPGAEPVDGLITTPATTSGGAVGGGTTGTVGQLPGTGVPVLPVLPGLPDPRQPAPVATAAPTDPADPAATQPPAAPLALAATLGHVADAAEDGFLGYAGTVRIDNPGNRDVTGWRVTLTVPGGNPATASGVTPGG